MSETLIHKQIIRSNAKYVRLSVNAKGEVIISTPYALSPKKQNNIINDNRAWLDKQLLQFQQHKKTYELPTSIHFPAIDRSWQIAYQPSTQRPKLLQLNENELVIYGEWNWFKILLLVCIGGSAVSSLYPFMISGSRKSLAVKLVFIMFVAGVMRDQRIYPFFYGIGFLEFAIFFLAALIIMANLVLAGQYICDLLKS